MAIPDPFDEVYLQYNALQKQQGFDLEPLAGKVCRQWVYEVTNYPAETPVHANLLVYEDRVVGGDICSTELDGFMLPFDALGSGNAGAASSAGSSALPESAVSSRTPASSRRRLCPRELPSPLRRSPANAWPTDEEKTWHDAANVRGIVPCSCVWPAGGFCSLRKERLYSRGKTDIIEESNLDGCENMPKERLDKVLASQNIGSRKESGRADPARCGNRQWAGGAPSGQQGGSGAGRHRGGRTSAPFPAVFLYYDE